MRIAIIASLLLFGLTQAVAKINVVTTTQDLASIARAVGGSRVSVSSIVTGARDPHFIEARPSYMSRVASANLFIAIGLDLEVGYERPILDGSRNRRVAIGQPGHLYASAGCLILDRRTDVSRADGDVHPHGNPHIWLDPYNARQMAWNIRGALIRVDPAGRDDYEKSALAFLDRLDRAMFGAALVERFGTSTLWTWSQEGRLMQRLRENGAAAQLSGWAGKMAPAAGQAIISYHRSWIYFANRFGLEVVAELEPKPGIEPTPGHLASVVEIARSRNVKAIVQEPFYSRGAAEFVAGRTPAKVLVLPGSVGHTPAAADYFRLMDVIVDAVSSALR